jgi:hypothetical protein
MKKINYETKNPKEQLFIAAKKILGALEDERRRAHRVVDFTIKLDWECNLRGEIILKYTSEKNNYLKTVCMFGQIFNPFMDHDQNEWDVLRRISVYAGNLNPNTPFRWSITHNTFLHLWYKETDRYYRIIGDHIECQDKREQVVLMYDEEKLQAFPVILDKLLEW